MRAIVLLSGGLDSTVMLAKAIDEGKTCLALSFDYNQRHRIELQAAEQIAKHYDTEHKVIRLDRSLFGKSALTGEMEVPKGHIPSGISSTYVPARNTLFLTCALMQAEIWNAPEIHIGACADDQNGYPDCRPDFFKSFEAVARLGTKVGVEGGSISIKTPLIEWNKRKIYEEGLRLKAPIELTWSCYDPQSGNLPCKLCPACLLREKFKIL